MSWYRAKEIVVVLLFIAYVGTIFYALVSWVRSFA